MSQTIDCNFTEVRPGGRDAAYWHRTRHDMQYQLYLLHKSNRRWNFFCHVFYPFIHTDRPRCYALMREDYLWSPLQSACSMQHLRSVSSVGRQCGPPPNLTCPPPIPPITTHHHHPPPPFMSNPPSTFPLCSRAPFLTLQVPWVWCASILLLPASPSPMQMFHGNHSRHTLLLSAHTFSLTPDIRGASQNRGNVPQISQINQKVYL